MTTARADTALERAIAALLPDLAAQTFSTYPDETFGLNDPDDDEPGSISLMLDEGLEGTNGHTLLEGGPGSGFHGHAGRPGVRGGSVAQGGGSTGSEPPVMLRFKGQREKTEELLTNAGTSLDEIIQGYSLTHQDYRVSDLYLDAISESDTGRGRSETKADEIYVRGQITNRDTGRKAGDFERRIKLVEGVVLHDAFFIKDADQGKGIAADLNAQSFALYKKLGLSEVHTDADGAAGIGRYAWALQGFDFRFTNTRDDQINGFKHFVGFEMVKAGKESQRAAIDQALAKVQHAWDIARFRIDDRKIGKEFLIQSTDWPGVMHLKGEGAPEAATVFKAYQAEAVKKIRR